MRGVRHLVRFKRCRNGTHRPAVDGDVDVRGRREPLRGVKDPSTTVPGRVKGASGPAVAGRRGAGVGAHHHPHHLSWEFPVLDVGFVALTLALAAAATALVRALERR